MPNGQQNSGCPSSKSTTTTWIGQPRDLLSLSSAISNRQRGDFPFLFLLGIGPEGGEALSSHHVWMFIPSVRLSICLYVRLSICLYICMSVRPYICMSVCPYICTYVPPPDDVALQTGGQAGGRAGGRAGGMNIHM
jgi:hypothetical protein